MKKTNKVIQTIFIAVIILLALSMLYDAGLGMYILLLGIPLGFSQVVYGAADVAVYKKESPFRIYLFASLVTLGLIFFTGYDGRLIPEAIREFMAYALALASVLLAIYFWIITYRGERSIAYRRHSIFNL